MHCLITLSRSFGHSQLKYVTCVLSSVSSVLRFRLAALWKQFCREAIKDERHQKKQSTEGLELYLYHFVFCTLSYQYQAISNCTVHFIIKQNALCTIRRLTAGLPRGISAMLSEVSPVAVHVFLCGVWHWGAAPTNM